MWRIFSAIPLGMEITRKFIQIKGYSVRLVGDRGGFDETRVKRESPHQGELPGVVKPFQGGPGEGRPEGRCLRRQVRDNLARIAEDRPAAGVAVLNVENRVVARLFDHL